MANSTIALPNCCEYKHLRKEVEHSDKAFKQLLRHAEQLEQYGRRLRALTKPRRWNPFDVSARSYAASRGMRVIQGREAVA